MSIQSQTPIYLWHLYFFSITCSTLSDTCFSFWERVCRFVGAFFLQLHYSQLHKKHLHLLEHSHSSLSGNFQLLRNVTNYSTDDVCVCTRAKVRNSRISHCFSASIMHHNSIEYIFKCSNNNKNGECKWNKNAISFSTVNCKLDLSMHWWHRSFCGCWWVHYLLTHRLNGNIQKKIF